MEYRRKLSNEIAHLHRIECACVRVCECDWVCVCVFERRNGRRPFRGKLKESKYFCPWNFKFYFFSQTKINYVFYSHSNRSFYKIRNTKKMAIAYCLVQHHS